MWAVWVVGGLAVWLVLAFIVAVVIGRSIRLADRRELSARQALWSVGELTNVAAAPATPAAVRTVVTARPKRRKVPLPPIGVALAALAVTLEATGFVLRLSGAQGEAARLFSMDAPLSVPRMYVTAVFAAASVAALSAAGRLPARRAWWTAVGVIGAAICFVKAGGNVHADALHWLTRTIGSAAALAVSLLLAAAVLGLLWYLARGERRDRLRVLGSLALYAAAAVGLSAISSSMTGARAAAAATFVEESGEALGAVVFLVAVLVGVAPRLVLPADWALRRSADAQTIGATDPIATTRHAAPGR